MNDREDKVVATARAFVEAMRELCDVAVDDGEARVKERRHLVRLAKMDRRARAESLALSAEIALVEAVEELEDALEER